jgi:hypothetical protein
MTNPEPVKPFILHEDLDVRILATTFFSDAWSDDPELLPLVLDASEKYGFVENSRCLDDATHFVVSDVSLLRVLRLLEGQDDSRIVDSLNSLIVSAPGELLREHATAIEGNPEIKSDTLRRVRRRIEYLEWSADQLWNELQAFSRRADKDNSLDIDQDYATDLIRDLARHNTPDAETLCRLIREPENESRWLQLFLIDLAGHRRLREAVETLVEELHEDDDLLLENSSAALGQIGEVEAVRLIRRQFPDASDDFRLYASGVLGKIRQPEAESAILEMLEREADDGIRMWLCAALCDQISERCLDLVGHEIANDVTMTRRELSGPLLAVATILGQELPAEAAQWREVRDQQREAIARFSTEESDWDDIEPDPGIIGHFFDAEPGTRISSAIPAPIRNTGPRVGRNDPCPCGSGKKFKKCCGKA